MNCFPRSGKSYRAETTNSTKTRFKMNRRRFLKTISFLAALPFLPKVLTKRLDSVGVKAVFRAPRTLTGSEWARLLAPDLRDVYIETGKERPLEYPTFGPSEEEKK